MAFRLSRTGIVFALLIMTTTPSTAQVEAERWTFSATFRQSFTDDLLLIGPGGPGEAISSATVTLGFRRRSRRSSFTVSGWLNGRLFKRFDTFDGAAAGISLSGDNRLDRRRTRLRYSVTGSDGINFET